MDPPIRLVNVSGSPGQALYRLAVLVGALACVPTASVAQNAQAGVDVRAYGAVGLAIGEPPD